MATIGFNRAKNVILSRLVNCNSLSSSGNLNVTTTRAIASTVDKKSRDWEVEDKVTHTGQVSLSHFFIIFHFYYKYKEKHVSSFANLSLIYRNLVKKIFDWRDLWEKQNKYEFISSILIFIFVNEALFFLLFFVKYFKC
jgi:hypothetical protein